MKRLRGFIGFKGQAGSLSLFNLLNDKAYHLLIAG